MKILTETQVTNFVTTAVGRLAYYIRKANIKNLVLGISGGRDSAIMLVIGLEAIKFLRRESYECGYIYDFIGVESDPNDLLKARLLAEEFDFKLNEYDYTDWYRQSPIRDASHLSLTKIRVANGNLKCRIRMLHLYDRAQLYNGIVLDTDDLSELLMGFWTRHGDVGDVKVLQFITKEELGDIGEFMRIPSLILDSAPGDGLGVTDTNKAKDQLKMDYLKSDYVLSRLIQNNFNYNGSFSQIEDEKYVQLMVVIATEIDEPIENVLHVVKQSLSTSFKRIHGDDVANLIPNRREIGFPEIGTTEFNEIYLKAIKSSSK